MNSKQITRDYLSFAITIYMPVYFCVQKYKSLNRDLRSSADECNLFD